jgi:hypothetical protein
MRNPIYRLRDDQQKRFKEQKRQADTAYEAKDFRNSYLFFLSAIDAYSRFIKHEEGCIKCDRFDAGMPLDFKWNLTSRIQLLFNLKSLFSDLFYSHNDQLPDLFSRSQDDHVIQSYLYRLLYCMVQVLTEYKKDFTEEQLHRFNGTDALVKMYVGPTVSIEEMNGLIITTRIEKTKIKELKGLRESIQRVGRINALNVKLEPDFSCFRYLSSILSGQKSSYYL